jgi:hypothetical protein
MSVLPLPHIKYLISLVYLSVIRELLRRLQRILGYGWKNSNALGDVKQTC